MLSKLQLKSIRSLHQKKIREQEKLFISEGFKLIDEAINTQPSLIKMIIHTPENRNSMDFSCIPDHVTIEEINSSDFSKLTTLENPQGILAILRQPEQTEPVLSESDELLLILDGIRDPGNMGTIIRIADWFGIDKIICSPDTVECYNPKVVQSSMGSIFRVRMHYLSLPDFIRTLRDRCKYNIYGSSLKGENVYTSKLNVPAALILGSESHGISKVLGDLAVKNLLIPDYSKTGGHAESLNVSVAAAIFCSEFRRRNLVIQSETKE